MGVRGEERKRALGETEVKSSHEPGWPQAEIRLSLTLTLSCLPSRCHLSPPTPMVLTLQGPHQSPVMRWWDMLSPLCGVSSQSAAELAFLLHRGPWGWEANDRPVLAGTLLCSQGPAGSPETQPSILIQSPMPTCSRLPDSSLHGLSPLCSPCWNPPFP